MNRPHLFSPSLAFPPANIQYSIVNCSHQVVITPQGLLILSVEVCAFGSPAPILAPLPHP